MDVATAYYAYAYLKDSNGLQHTSLGWRDWAAESAVAWIVMDDAQGWDPEAGCVESGPCGPP